MNNLKKIMLIIALPLLLLHFSIQAQSPKVKVVLDKTIEIMKTNSASAKDVNWDKLTVEAYQLAKNAVRPEDLGNSIRFLFKSLEDFHGRFSYNDSIFRWRKEKKIMPEVYKKEFAKFAKESEAFFTSENEFLTRNVEGMGYLRIPTTDQSIANERAQALQDSLCKLLSKNPKGLIFDLRLNGGGHVFSMVMGISNILSYGFVSPTGEVRSDGYYENSNRILDYKEICKRDHLNIPIAVIIGPYTGSSAEGLTVVLKNRPNTILIGEPTAGWVSAVDGFKIDDNGGINLSIGYIVDVNKKVYKDKIQPDILVKDGDNFGDVSKDEKVKKSIAWLKGFELQHDSKR